MKTNSKHTKGPWNTEINNGELEIWSQDIFIAGVTHDLYFTAEKSGQHAANAALIAAAPEMLEALENALESLKYSVMVLQAPEKSTMRENITEIEAVLKKARGE